MTTAQDQQSRAELLPCPFCGSESVIMEQYKSDGLRILCKNCAVKREQRTIRQSIDWLREGMIADWNRAPAEQAARALPARGVDTMLYTPAGMEPVGEVVIFGGDCKEISWRKGKLPPVGTNLFTAAQVLAMGRVPPGWQAVPVEPTEEMKRGAQMAAMDHSDHGEWLTYEWQDVLRTWKGLLAAAPRPPAAQEKK